MTAGSFFFLLFSRRTARTGTRSSPAVAVFSDAKLSCSVMNLFSDRVLWTLTFSGTAGRSRSLRNSLRTSAGDGEAGASGLSAASELASRRAARQQKRGAFMAAPTVERREKQSVWIVGNSRRISVARNLLKQSLAR